MEELFPAMMRSYVEAARILDSGVLGEIRIDTLSFLHTRILQRNSVLKLEHQFTNRLIPDIINYAYLLQENEVACAEYADYQLGRPGMFGDDPFAKYDALFLQEVLQGIIDNSNEVINPPL
jgi:hypothetical protein